MAYNSNHHYHPRYRLRMHAIFTYCLAISIFHVSLKGYIRNGLRTRRITDWIL